MPKNTKFINYITHDAWWDSDYSILSQLQSSFLLKIFVFSSKFYSKKFPSKALASDRSKIFEAERKYKLSNPLSLVSAFRFIKIIKKEAVKNSLFVYVFMDDPYFNFLFILLFRKGNTIISFHNYKSHSDGKFFDNVFKIIFIKYFIKFHLHSENQYLQFSRDHESKTAYFTEMQLKDFGKPSNKFPNKPNVVNFLFFGYIREYKRIDLFIEAANKLDSKAMFSIYGSCKNWENYNHLIKEPSKFNLNIRFIDNTEIPDIFNESSFLVLPYSDTTQSGPLLVAYNYNLPVIASDLPLFTEMITNGEDGFIFKHDDLEDLVKYLKIAANLNHEEYQAIKKNQLISKAIYMNKTNNVVDIFNKIKISL